MTAYDLSDKWRQSKGGRPVWQQGVWGPSLAVAGLYAVVAALWIVGSDWAVQQLARTPDAQTMLQTYKGWAFVLVTASLLAVALRAAWRGTIEAKDELENSKDRLELALSSAGGGIWDRDLVEDRVYISPQMKRAIGFGENFPSSLEQWRERIHPDDLEAVRDSTRRAIEAPEAPIHDVRYRVRHRDGDYRWLRSRARVFHDQDDHPTRMIGVVLDVTAQLVAEEQVAHLVRYDPLTGLANRTTFRVQLDDILSTGQPERVVLVTRLDIDRFKEVNDEFGSETGDRVLQIIADRIKAAAGRAALVARMGADEFAVAIPDFERTSETQRAVKTLASVCDTPFEVDGRSVQLSASIGAAVHPDDGETAEQLLKSADVALSKARDVGAQTHFFARGMDEDFRLRARRGQDLRGAADRGELELHYQPVVNLADGATLGFEALVRWRRPEEGLVRPDQFIGLAEDLGYIGDIGRAVLRQACREASAWQRNDGEPPYVAVNVSPRQFDDPDFVGAVWRTLEETGLPPNRLELEVTETALSRDPDMAQQRLEALRALGISVAIDDFGTGYSSLGALESMPLSRLKIDKSFVGRYGERDRSTVIVDSILGLAAALQLPVTAEGVETAEQMALLRAKGAGAAQGYWFSRPVARTDVPSLLDRAWLQRP